MRELAHGERPEAGNNLRAHGVGDETSHARGTPVTYVIHTAALLMTLYAAVVLIRFG